MTINKRNLFLGTAAILVVLAVAVLPELRHQPSTLLGRAHKAAFVGTWDAKHDNYFWLSNEEALLVTQASGPIYKENGPVTVRRVNADTGVTVEDVPLEAELHKANVDSIVPNWQLSPDGKWLLGESNSHTIKQFWVATTTDGAHQVTRSHQYDEHEDRGIFAVWRPDSQSWVQVIETDDKVHAYLYHLAGPAVTGHVEDTNLNGNVAVGFYSADRIFCIRPQTGDGGGIGMMDLGVLASSTPVRNGIQHIPATMDVQQVVLSPDRSRLAWKFTVKPLPLGLKGTVNSSYVRRSSPVTTGLWTTDLNLNNLHEIGTLDIRDDHITNLRWMPDGKRLSFIDGDALYTVPAD